MGIRTRLISAIALVTFAAITLMGVFAIEVLKQNAFYREVREARLIAGFFKVASRNSPAEVMAISQSLIRQGRINNIRIFDRGGRVVFSHGESTAPDEGRLIVFEDGVSVRYSSPGWLISNISGALIVSVDLKDSGRVVYTTDISRIAEELRPAKRFVLFFSIASGLV
ncbi:MAG: hypothetical protein HY880_05855, partial [Deltaproteobacteria bacterium]|nr:hypothetical protein [Deltaproteobacteria bacterium]